MASTQQSAILFPVLALVALTFVVAVRMFLQRVGEMRARRIHPQAVATSQQRSQRLEATTAADNFGNLLELPILFYVLCLALLATQSVSSGFVWAAWAFVLFRMLHSLIQCTYNRVTHRFGAYVAAFVVLAGMWAAFAVALFGSGPGAALAG